MRACCPLRFGLLEGLLDSTDTYKRLHNTNFSWPSVSRLFAILGVMKQQQVERLNRQLAEKIARVLQDFRKERNLSQERLAIDADMWRTTVGNIEQANKGVTVQTLHRVLTPLGVSLSEFFLRVDSTDQV